ncbi:MAG: Txe/YoeB family addiction module toxin [Fibrobacter sp.]|jgi:toxin YoeB|uniref:Txe/YoeB family addiction module toxin n=1 Tax=Fibrobacter sp. TaxID=35828 RepID=UPI001B00962D|nr:Txe/YoeB family addiction module toxin [Fibrobacter sp.]MBO7059681.1 Txe/YoeB family addiction module toxin [Fibrobacter sp.]
MAKIAFSERAWAEYLYWQSQDKKTLKRINQLVRDVERSPFEGIGKPEALVGNLSGFWSRRIDDKNRLIYRIKGEFIEILSCREHY